MVEQNSPKNYFKMPVRNLFLSGISIYDVENPLLRKLHRVYSVILLLTCGYGYVITEIIHAIKHFQELEVLTLTLCYIFAHTIAIGKIVVLTIRRKPIGKFLKSLETGVFLPDIERGGVEEVNIISTAAKIFGIVVVLMLATKIIPCIRNPTITRFTADNKTEIIPVFPYPSTLPFHVDYGATPYYQIAFCYQVFSIALFGWYLGNTDTIITGLMIHGTAQFRIVINAILTVTERAARMTPKNEPIHDKLIMLNYVDKKNNLHLIETFEKYQGKYIENLRKCVRGCVIHHQSIIQLLDDIEKTFSLLFLIQFLGSLMSLCVGLYQSSVSPISDPTSVSMASFTTAMFFQLLIYCWNGNEISVYSVLVAKAAYNCDWLQADKDIKTSIMLIMMRAQRPLYLTAGKFSKISLETFTAVLRGSVSYFMVLNKMQEEQMETAK
nr:odorant receptor 49b-like [Onthophagus taurus]XP_022899913.1 odorant receptor 49b-like [Onthophagus taurus]